MVTHRLLVPFFKVRVLVGERLALESLGIFPGIFHSCTYRNELFAVGEGVNLRLQSDDRVLQRVNAAEQLG